MARKTAISWLGVLLVILIGWVVFRLLQAHTERQYQVFFPLGPESDRAVARVLDKTSGARQRAWRLYLEGKGPEPRGEPMQSNPSRDEKIR